MATEKKGRKFLSSACKGPRDHAALDVLAEVGEVGGVGEVVHTLAALDRRYLPWSLAERHLHSERTVCVLI